MRFGGESIVTVSVTVTVQVGRMRRPWRNISVIFIAWLLFVFCYGRVYPSPSLFGGAARVLLLTAHPDDECMFFAPTILSLLQSSVVLFSVCLSVGKNTLSFCYL
jgi:N-acetylglucosaminylphosphatidylinositol deacetylase